MDEVAAIVRAHDKGRYLAALFAPEAKRPHLLALYAFQAEMARIAALVSEPQLAEIRLQWWLDVLDSIYAGEPQAHPVAAALAAAITEGDIPKFPLANMAKAHQFDFYSDPMPSLHDLEGYLGETSGALVQLGAMILDKDGALGCGEAAGLAGVAYGLAQLLAQLPQMLRLKQCFLPTTLLAARELSAETFSAPENEAALSIVLAELRVQADKRLRELQQVAWTISPSVSPAFLHVALAEPLLARAKARGAGLLTRGGEISQLRAQFTLWKAARSVLF
jgi:phytoene synthase